MKKLIIIFSIISIIFNSTMQCFAEVPASATINLGNRFIEISGSLEQSEFKNTSYVTLMFKDGDEIKQLDQVYISVDGTYRYECKYSSNVRNCDIYVRAGNKNIVSSVENAVVKQYVMFQTQYTQNYDGSAVNVTADVTDIYKTGDLFKVIAAAYDNNSSLIGTKYSSDIRDDYGRKKVDLKIDSENKPDSVKVFVWSSIEQVIPISETHLNLEYDCINANFGTVLDNQYLYGYDNLIGDTVYERYINAKAEIPSEVPIISPFIVSQPIEYFVATWGDDTADGSYDSPFKNIQTALDKVKSLSDDEKKNGVSIFIREGTYNINEPLTLDGTTVSENNKGLYISSYDNEKVILSGAKSVNMDDFSLADEKNIGSKNFNRINSAVKDKLYCIDYSDIGISNNDGIQGFVEGIQGASPSLFADNNKQLLARYPNISEDNVESVIKDGTYIDGDGNRKMGLDAEFVPDDKEVFNWMDTGKIAVFGQFSVSWSRQTGLISLDYDASSIKVAKNTLNDGNTQIGVRLNNNKNVASHFYYMNALEAIDIPGEWCADDITKKLYYYPAENVSSSSEITLNDGTVDSIFDVDNCNGVVFNGLDVKHADRLFYIKNSQNVIVQNSTLSHANISAVRLYNSKKCGATYSIIENSVNAFSTYNLEACEKLLPSRNFLQASIVNNISYDAVSISGCGDIISHNTLENLYDDGIYIGQSVNAIVEYNDITACVLQGNEGCNCYTSGNYSTTNNHVRYNYFHDNNPKGAARTSGGALMIDDMGDGAYFYNNIFNNLGYALGANGGDNEIFDSNTIVDCNNSICNADSYIVQETVNRQALHNMTKSNLMSGYYGRFYDNLKWNNRFAYLKAKALFVETVADKWKTKKGNYKTGDADIDFYLAPTGNYVINNTISDCNKDITLGSTTDDYILKGIDYTQSSNIEQYKGHDYNVVSNNHTVTGYNVCDAEGFNSIGLPSDFTHNYLSSENSSIDIVYSGIEKNKTGIIWRTRDDCNYYKIIIATDAAMQNIVKEVYTNFDRCMQYLAKGKYYYKVCGYSNNYYKQGLEVASTGVITLDVDVADYISTGTIVDKDYLLSKPSGFVLTDPVNDDTKINYNDTEGYKIYSPTQNLNVGIRSDILNKLDGNNGKVVIDFEQKISNYYSKNNKWGATYPTIYFSSNSNPVIGGGNASFDSKFSLSQNNWNGASTNLVATMVGVDNKSITPVFVNSSITTNEVLAEPTGWNRLKIEIDFNQNTVTVLNESDEMLLKYQLDNDINGFGNVWGQSIYWTVVPENEQPAILQLKNLSITRYDK